MAGWKWYPSGGKHGSWNEVADLSFSPAVGCSNTACTERAICWARRGCKRFKPHPQESYQWNEAEQVLKRINYGCQKCYDFKPHDHFERWEKFHPKPGSRVALGWQKGDLFDPERSDEAIEQHMISAAQWYCRSRHNPSPTWSECTWLILSRRIQRIVEFLPRLHWAHFGSFEFGTTLSSSADLENVRALAQLPVDVVRFLSIEPIPDCEIPYFEIEHSRISWCLLGNATRAKGWPISTARCIEEIADTLRSINVKVVFKRSCGPRLYKQNERVVLP